MDYIKILIQTVQILNNKILDRVSKSNEHFKNYKKAVVDLINKTMKAENLLKK